VSVRTDPLVASRLRALGIEPGDADRLDLARAGSDGRLALRLLDARGQLAGVHVVSATRPAVTVGAGGVLGCRLIEHAMALGFWPGGRAHTVVVTEGSIPFLQRATCAPRGAAVLGVIGHLPREVAARIPAGTSIVLRCGDTTAASVAAATRRHCRVMRGQP
jgi:hypothetical protein